MLCIALDWRFSYHSVVYLLFYFSLCFSLIGCLQAHIVFIFYLIVSIHWPIFIFGNIGVDSYVVLWWSWNIQLMLKSFRYTRKASSVTSAGQAPSPARTLLDHYRSQRAQLWTAIARVQKKILPSYHFGGGQPTVRTEGWKQSCLV
jgi:hypothetical protein